MSQNIKMGTLNFCLGLKNKKISVKNSILTKKIDILLLRETEIQPSYDHNFLTFSGYNLEVEKNGGC